MINFIKKLTICIILVVPFAQGCSKKYKVQITEISKTSPDSAVTHEIKEEKLDIKPDEITPEISKQLPTNQKFKLDDESLDLEIAKTQNNNVRPIMVAVMAPMSGKNDMIGNAIMDGAHLSLINLFEKHKIPVRLNVIDTGSSIEDIEFNISKLDENEFDMILGLTSEDQEEFVSAYLGNIPHKPFLVTLNPFSHQGNTLCTVSPQDQMKVIMNNVKATDQDSILYVVLSMSEDSKPWNIDGVKILQYGTKDVQQTNDDLQKIASRIAENDKKIFVVFTDSNWKLQKFMTQIENLNIQDRTQIILASLSHLNGRMQTVGEKRHKFGNIAIVTPEENQYNAFMRDFYKNHQRKPLELSFWAYNAIQGLQNANFDSVTQKWSLGNNTANFCQNSLKFLGTK